MLQMVPLPVQLMLEVPGPKYSTILLVPPFTVSSPQSLRMMSFGAAQPDNAPRRWTPMIFGTRVLYGHPAMASTASAPPTPMAIIPRPPAFGVCESVPIIIPPGNA